MKGKPQEPDSILLVTPSGCREPNRFRELAAEFRIVEVSGFRGLSLSQAESAKVRGIWLNFDSLVLEEDVAKFPYLDFIATSSTGVDHISIPPELASKIKVISLEPRSGELDSITSTVELTWALIFAQFARVESAYLDVLSGSWMRSKWARDSQLSEQVLGVVGYGRIGRGVAQIGASFGMRTLVCEKNPERMRSAELKGHVVVSLEEIVTQSNWVSLHVEGSDSNSELINDKILRTAKPFHLVNTSRGAIVQEEAVVRALQDSRLLSYSADVLTAESRDGNVSGSVILQHATNDGRILLTPHIGGATVSAYEKVEDIVAKKILHRCRSKAVAVGARS